MDIHENARTTPHSRMLIVQRLAAGWTVAAVAAAQGVTAKTVRKWRDRDAAEDLSGLADRTSKPGHSPTRLAAHPKTRSTEIGHRVTGDRTRQSNRRAVGQGVGWEFLHVAIDDALREWAYAQPFRTSADRTARHAALEEKPRSRASRASWLR